MLKKKKVRKGNFKWILKKSLRFRLMGSEDF